jgi:hypothetical protein
VVAASRLEGDSRALAVDNILLPERKWQYHLQELWDLEGASKPVC